MNSPRKILAFAGSTRAGSLNKRALAVAAQAADEAGARVTTIDLADYRMPLYDGDLESRDGLPEAAIALKTLFIEHDGLLIAAPEYNGSITGVLKNTLDWVSRPHGEQPGTLPYRDKFAALVAASPGALGGLRGLVHVRQILTGLGVHVIPPQFALSRAGQAFDDAGTMTDDKQRDGLRAVGAELASFLKRVGD